MKVASLTQHSGCYKGGCALVAESSKRTNRETEKQLSGSWASRGTSSCGNERSWKLLTAVTRGWRWLSAPPLHKHVPWEGVGERVGSEQNVTLLSSYRGKKSLSSRGREVAIKTWSWAESSSRSPTSPASAPEPESGSREGAGPPQADSRQGSLGAASFVCLLSVFCFPTSGLELFWTTFLLLLPSTAEDPK